MNRITNTLLSLAIVGACLASIPFAARVGLLILSTAPNPRHPPGDLLGEAVGWTIIGTIVGAVVVIIAESTIFQERQGIYQSHKGVILGTVVALALGTTLGIVLAIIEMDSVDGQAITSTGLGVISGAVASSLGVLAGAGIGATLRRLVLLLSA